MSNKIVEVSFKTDPDGFISQQCPECNRYFKVKFEKSSKKKLSYCPYCSFNSESFLTEKQINYAKDMMSSKVVLPLLKKFGNSFSSSSKFIQVKSEYKCKPHALAPIEDNRVNKIIQFSCCAEDAKIRDSWNQKVYCIICKKEFESLGGEIRMNSAYDSFEKSYKRLKDYAENVLSSDRANFETNLKIFINHVEKDGFFSPITKQLNNHPRVVDGWWKTALDSRSSFVGSGKLDLPEDEEERLALLYQLCKSINSNEIKLTTIAMTFFGGSNLNYMVQKFNETFFTPFLKLLEYKIDEIEEKVRIDESTLGSNEKYTETVKTVINVHGDNLGIISTGDNTTNTLINSEPELINRLLELKTIEDVEDKSGFKNLVDEIVHLTKDNEDKITIVQKLGELIGRSPSVKSKLKQIAFNAGIAVSSNVVIEGIKFVLGI